MSVNKQLLNRLPHKGTKLYKTRSFKMLPRYVEFIGIQMVYERSRKHNLMLTKRRSKPSGTVGVVADWYFRVLVKERAALVPGTKERYREWKVYTGDESLFTVDGQFYEQVYVFMGLETFYWIFFRKTPHVRKHGKAPLACTYCGCCIFSQFPTIIENVKECIKLEDIPDEDDGKKV